MWEKALVHHSFVINKIMKADEFLLNSSFWMIIFIFLSLIFGKLSRELVRQKYSVLFLRYWHKGFMSRPYHSKFITQLVNNYDNNKCFVTRKIKIFTLDNTFGKSVLFSSHFHRCDKQSNKLPKLLKRKLYWKKLIFQKFQ